MKNNIKIFTWFLVFSILTLFTGHAFSQVKANNLKVSFLSESISLPFFGVKLNPVHPGICIGTDLILKDKTSFYRTFGISASYYYHQTYEHALMFDAEYNLGYTFSFKLRPTFITAIGYKHSFLAGNTYVLEDGNYKEKTHPGQPQLNFKLGTGMEYQIKDNISISIAYTGMLALPYAPNSGIPFSTHTFLRMGTSIKL